MKIRGDMPFAIGAEVLVASLGRSGRVVEAGAGGRYRVAVGPLVVSCVESELSATRDAKRKDRRRGSGASPEQPSAGPQAATTPELTAQQRRALGSIDLHGMTVEEALREVGLRLDRAIRAGLERLEIIHGISGGRLRAAVRGYLAGIPSVRRFEADAKNPGVTWVYF